LYLEGFVSSKKSKQPKLIVVSAPSGAGKTTLCEMLIKEFPNIGLSISMTTRQKRPYEKDGVHYRFVEKSEFKKMIAKGLFAEYAEVHDHLYGTPKTEIESKLSKGLHVLFDIDVQGAMNLKKQYKDRVLLLFIHPPSMKALHDRLVQRKGDSGTSIETRLQNAYNELEWSKSFDYQIVNDDLNQAYQQLKEIVTKECL
jgi:guanylate kinase